MDTLDSHPRVAAYDELFYGAGGAPAHARSDLSNFVSYRPRSVWARRLTVLRRLVYLRGVYRRRPGVQAVGFKLMYVQARSNPGLLPFLALRRARAIHLVRANLLDAAISYDVARSSGVFHVPHGESVSSVRVRLDPDRLVARLEGMALDISHARSWLERFRFPRLEVVYEELAARPEETLGKILRFLGIRRPVDGLHSRLVPSTDERGLRRVENPDEVRAALAGSRFEWMIAEARR
jgi:hypothetical protein